MTAGRQADDNPGPIAPDGCPVEVYRQLPTNGEPDLIDSVLPPRSRVLELGCGTGRLANALARRGHEVWGVDESSAMLDHLHAVTAVRARIEQVRLHTTFVAVLLVSNLISTAGPDRRRRYLHTCARHLAADGILVVQWYPPSWFTDVGERVGRLGPVHGGLKRGRVDDDHCAVEATYRIGDRAWTQRFDAYVLTEDQLAAELRQAGLHVDRWLDDARSWFVARHVSR